MARVAATNRVALGSSNRRFRIRDMQTSLGFTGVNTEFVTLSGLSTYNFIQNTGVFTLGCWVELAGITGTNNYGFMGNTAGAAGDKGFNFWYNGTADALRFAAYNTSGLAFFANSTFKITPEPHLGARAFLAVKSNGGATVELFFGVGNTPLIKNSVSGTFTSYATGASSRTLLLGVLNGTSPSVPARGAMDDFLISDQFLSDAQLDDIYYDRKLPSTYTGSFYDCNEGSGSTLLDSGSFANNGVITSVAYASNKFNMFKRSAVSGRVAA